MTKKKEGIKLEFGNQEHIDMVKHEQMLANTKRCVFCDGTGGRFHSCDCRFCKVDGECQECEGTGRLPKNYRI